MEEIEPDYQRIQEELEASVMRDIIETGATDEECLIIYENWMKKYHVRDTQP